MSGRRLTHQSCSAAFLNRCLRPERSAALAIARYRECCTKPTFYQLITGTCRHQDKIDGYRKVLQPVSEAQPKTHRPRECLLFLPQSLIVQCPKAFRRSRYMPGDCSLPSPIENQAEPVASFARGL